MGCAFDFRWTTIPGNSGLVIPFDSTRGPHGMTYAAIAAGGSYLAPGSMRGKYRAALIRYTVKTTTQNVTGDEQVLTGVAGTSADWETQGAAGQYTVTAGTTTVREFKPLASDWRLLFTAGATGPATIVVAGVVVYTPDYGS